MIRVFGAVLVISWILVGLPEVTALDVWINRVLPRPLWLTETAYYWSLVFGPALAAVFGVALAVVAVVTKDPRGLVLFAVCWATLLSRHLFRRVRPIEHPLWSYPSGHTVAVAAVAFTLVVLLGKGVLPATVAVILTGASRVVLERHWLTDVVGAVLGVVGVGLLAALLLGLVTSGRDVVPQFRRSRRSP